MSRWRYLDFESPELTVLADGVTVADGRIALLAVPASPQSVGAELEADAGFVGPAGIAVDAAGNIYAADPDSDGVIRIDGCDGSSSRVRCIELSAPRGVAVGARNELYISDSGRHRIVVVDLATTQTVGIWGSADPYGDGSPSGDPGLLSDPTDLAVDSAGNLYVIDRGNGRVQRFSSEGVPDPAFWEEVSRGTAAPTAPIAVAAAAFGDDERLLVLDLRAGRIRVLVYRTDGSVDTERTEHLRDEVAGATSAGTGIVADDDAIYVADATRNRVLVFDASGTFVGVTGAVPHRASGLALDDRGRLVLNVGSSSVVRFADLGTVVAGTLVAGPIAIPREDGDSLASVTIAAEPLPTGALFRAFVWPCSDTTLEWPELDSGDWIAGPPNTGEVVFPLDGASHVWLALRLEAGEGGAPALGRARIESGLEAWLYDLPPVYGRDEEARPFLERLLGALRDGYGEQEERIDDLPLLFDADTAVDDAPSAAWLDWLAGWLAFPLGDVRRSMRRHAVARAFSLNSRRGTADGLREGIDLVLGAQSWISEPAQRAGLWMLDGESALGFGTTLAAAEAQGAVVGTTATLDFSSLTRDPDFGAPLFDDLAHHFCVGVYAAEIGTPQARATLSRLVERERPAHTTAHICVVEPRARIGFQARVGVDAIVAGPTPALRLGTGVLGASATTSAQRPAPAAGLTRIGERGG